MTERKRKKRQYTAEDVARFRAQYAASPEESAAIVGIHPATFYRRVMPHVLGGAIQSLKIGACRRIVVASLLQWADRQGGTL
jgi:hypothetical protein